MAFRPDLLGGGFPASFTDLTVTGTVDFSAAEMSTLIIDVTDPEALLVRKDGDTGDVLTVDTSNSAVGINTAPNGNVSFDVNGEWQYEVSSQNNNGMLFGVGSNDEPTIGPIVGGSEVTSAQLRYNQNQNRWASEVPFKMIEGGWVDDDSELGVGTNERFAFYKDSANTQFEFRNDNDSNIFTVQDSSQDVEFGGDIGLGITPTGNNGQILVDDSTDNSATQVNSYDGGVQISNSSQVDGSYSLFKFNHGANPDADGSYIRSLRKGNNLTQMELGQYDNGGNVAGTPYITMDENYNVTIPNGSLGIGGESPASADLYLVEDNPLFRIRDNNGNATDFQQSGGNLSIRGDDTNGNVIFENSSFTRALNVDVANSTVNIPNGTLTLSDGHIINDRLTVSSSQNTDSSGVYSVDSSGGTRTLTLASADAVDGAEIKVKRNGANTVTIDTESTETIDGSASIDLTADDEAVTLIFNSDNSDWEIF